MTRPRPDDESYEANPLDKEEGAAFNIKLAVGCSCCERSMTKGVDGCSKKYNISCRGKWQTGFGCEGGQNRFEMNASG